MTYDANGNQTSEAFYYYWNGSWIGITKTVMTYDDNGNLTSEVDNRWQNGTWVILDYDFKREYTYDAYGNQTSDAEYQWLDGAWVGQRKNEYAYDTFGHRTSEAYYGGWQDGAWVGWSRFDNIYDADGLHTSDAIYSWIDGAWEMKTYTLYYYSDHSTVHERIILAPGYTAPRKVLRDGQLRIESEGRNYGISGKLVP